MTTDLTLYGIIKKLVGPIIPSFDHNHDQERLRNLKELTRLVDKLLFDISDITTYAERPEASARDIGNHAKAFLDDVKNA